MVDHERAVKVDHLAFVVFVAVLILKRLFCLVWLRIHRRREQKRKAAFMEGDFGES